MKIELLQQWSALLGLTGVAGTVVAMLLKSVLERRSVNHEHRWQDEKERHGRGLDTDRATYNRPLTVLVRVNLAEFIRTGEWASDQADLIRVLTSLRRRTYEHFLDPVVNAAWEDLVAKSVELAGRRLTLRIEESEIREYNRIRAAWDDACKRSFGPFAVTTEDLTSRGGPRDSASGAA